MYIKKYVYRKFHIAIGDYTPRGDNTNSLRILMSHIKSDFAGSFELSVTIRDI